MQPESGMPSRPTLRFRDYLPESDHTEGSDAIGPSYSALVLSDSASEDPLDPDSPIDAMPSGIAPSIMERLERYEADAGRRELHRSPSEETMYIPMTQTSPAQNTSLHNIHSSADRDIPDAMAQDLLWPLQVWSHRSPGRRELHPNDPFTFLGVHEASSNSGQGMQHLAYIDQPSSALSPRPISPFQPSVGAGRTRRPEQHIPTQNNETQRPLQPRSISYTPLEQTRMERSLDAGESQSGTRNRPPYAMPLPPANVFISAPTHYDRSSEQHDQFDHRDTRYPENRSYVVRRRLNANGEEHVHSITMPDGELSASLGAEETPDSSFRPVNLALFHAYLRTRASRASNRDNGQTPGDFAAGRRRGWARLDADGNEIHEEDEDRYRAQWRSALLAGREQRQVRRENLVTRTSIFTGTDEGNVARVRLNTLASASRASTINADPASTGESHDCIGSCTPFYVDPLPMPLASMMSPPASAEHAQVIRVSPFANLAGR